MTQPWIDGTGNTAGERWFGAGATLAIDEPPPVSVAVETPTPGAQWESTPAAVSLVLEALDDFIMGLVVDAPPVSSVTVETPAPGIELIVTPPVSSIEPQALSPTFVPPMEVDPPPPAGITVEALTPGAQLQAPGTPASITTEAPAPSVYLSVSPSVVGISVEVLAPITAVYPPVASVNMWAVAPTSVGTGPATPPPASVAVTAPAPEIHVISIERLEPLDLAFVPTTLPSLQVWVQIATGDEPLIQVEVDDNSAFSTPTIITVTPEAVDGYAPNLLPVPAALTDDTVYYWRARATGDGGGYWTGWTTTRSFTVDVVASGVASQDGSLTVTADTALPHVWHLVPAVGEVGDTVIVVGTGFDAADEVFVADVEATVVGVSAVAGGVDAYTSSRTIDPLNGTITVAYEEIEITIPTVDVPGGALYVQRS